MWRRWLISQIPSWKAQKPDTSLEQLLDFAVKHVPYYKQFKNYKTLTDFLFLTKDIIRKESKSLLTDDIQKRKWYYNTSGGSTGEPVRLVQDVQMSRYSKWVRAETHRWAGYQPGQRLIKLWGSSSESSQYKQLKAKVGLWIRNEIFLDTFELSEEKICSYVGIINRFKPRLIVGYASSLYSISQYVLNHSIEIKDIGAIVSSAGTLYPEMRQAMENAFHCKVFNRYGSREVTIVAAEDGSDKGLRVTPIAYVEVVRADGSPCEEGEIGEIVVTSLANFAMPLIRYRIGDMGVLKKHGSQTYLEKIVGRTVELFKTKDGRLIDGEYFTHLTYFKDWIKNFRFRQIDYDYIVIEIVLCSTHKPPENELSEVEADVKKMMGDDVRINWKFVDSIEPLPSGKYVYTISDIK